MQPNLTRVARCPLILLGLFFLWLWAWISTFLAASFLVALLSPPALSQENLRVFRIGNSFTWDSRPERVDGLGGTTTAWDIRCGQPLSVHAADSVSPCVPPPAGEWHEALPLGWDALVVQPFRPAAGTDLSIQADLDAIQAFLDAATSLGEPLPTLYIYPSWPFTDSRETWDDWLAPWEGTRDRHRQDYYRQIAAHFQAQGVPTHVLPSADLLAYFWAHPTALGPETVPEDLYRDSIHLDSLGQSIVGYTVWASITGLPTLGLPHPFYGLPPDQVAVIQGAVDAVVQSQIAPQSLPLSALHNAWGNWVLGPDLNLDGVVNALDYTLWRDGQPLLQPLPNLNGFAVPEPITLHELVIAAVLYGLIHFFVIPPRIPK